MKQQSFAGLIMFITGFLVSNVNAGESEIRSILQELNATEIPNGELFRNSSGFSSTISTAGYIDLTNPFFQNLGNNGRRCVSCHLPNTGWTITPKFTRKIFNLTKGGVLEGTLGLGAIFRTNDGANSPNADVSNLAARRRAYNMLLTKGLIRIGIPMPANADFKLIGVDDPYGYASADELSLFRRPLPSTNLKYLSTIMVDGRETLAGNDHCNLPTEGGKCFASIHFDLADQSNSANKTHAQGNPLTSEQQESIVKFETSLTTAQIWDYRAGSLISANALGGPTELQYQVASTYYGINDNLNDYRTSEPFNPNVFSLYDAWSGSKNKSRSSVVRGQILFNTKAITISGVAGINGSVGSPFNPPLPDSFIGSCTTCHNTPNAGNHSIVAPLNIGIADASRRTSDMPLYTFQKLSDGTTIQSTDPGRALITGKFTDIGKFKGPILRGLAARAPYFHNGFAKDLDDVVDFYNTRFDMKLSWQEQNDLVAFLRTL